MRSCLHTYRTITNLTQHIIQPWGGGHQSSMGGGHQPSMGGGISQVWGGHQPTMGGGHQPSMGRGGHQPTMGGAISQVWGGHQPTMGGASAKYGGGGIFPPVCTGSQNPQNYFSNTYVLPSVNRTAGPIIEANCKVQEESDIPAVVGVLYIFVNIKKLKLKPVLEIYTRQGVSGGWILQESILSSAGRALSSDWSVNSIIMVVYDNFFSVVLWTENSY